ncbi:hypothetical protein BDR07DRAFT_1383789 [Suillus spraguei]|nr:hypothetical protein BDR07DRAFT_1383789 [Suillus spraguei]
MKHQEAQAYRKDDPSALGIYDVRLQRARSRKDVEIDSLWVAFRRTSERPRLGAAGWIAYGIPIEVALATETSNTGRHPTDSNMEHRPLSRIRDIDFTFMEDGVNGDCSCIDYSANDGLGGDRPHALFQPERSVIPLPSNMGRESYAVEDHRPVSEITNRYDAGLVSGTFGGTRH